ncbi:MAG: HD domain-containing protein [Anaerocolumna sp.]
MNISKVIFEMIDYYTDDIKRINHFLKVYAYAKTIGEMEALDERTQEILEVSAVVHDIGIKVSEEKYDSSAGHYQQIEGPIVAKPLLYKLGYDEEFINRVLYLIAHHHTYNIIDGLDYQILVEADFLVNFHEDETSKDTIKNVLNKIFKTKSGIEILHRCFLT